MLADIGIVTRKPGFRASVLFCLFDLILYVPSTSFQLNRDGSSWVEPVLSKDKCVLLKDHNTVTPVRLEPAALRFRVKHGWKLKISENLNFRNSNLNTCSMSTSINNFKNPLMKAITIGQKLVRYVHYVANIYAFFLPVSHAHQESGPRQLPTKSTQFSILRLTFQSTSKSWIGNKPENFHQCLQQRI